MAGNVGDSQIATPAVTTTSHDQVDLSQRVQTMAVQDAQAKTAAANPADQLAPTSTWSKFVDTTEQGFKDIPAGILHTVENPGKLIENATISIGMGALAKVILPETGPLGKLAALGLGAYFTEQTAVPIYQAYKSGLSAKTMGEINNAGSQLGDAVGGIAVNLPIGIYGYKYGSSLGESLMASPRMAGVAQFKADTINPLNDALSAKIASGKASLANLFGRNTEIIPGGDKGAAAASGDATLKGNVETTERAESAEGAAQPPKLPDRYAPIQEKINGQQVTGVSREFLKNLTTDQQGDYYGAGLRYPDLEADPDMKAYLEAQNKYTLAKIDPKIYQAELDHEAQAGGAFGKLPDGWDNATKPANAIDVTDGLDQNSMTVGSKTFKVVSDGAPNRKLVMVDHTAPGGERTIIPESKDSEILQVVHVDTGGQGKFAVVSSQDGASTLHLYDATGKLESQVPLPGYGTVHDVRVGDSPSQLKFLYDSPISPPQVVTVDAAANTSGFTKLPGYNFDGDNYTTDKLVVPYKDVNGNMQNTVAFVSYPKDLVKDGSGLALHEIYGGFDVAPQYLRYMANSASWLKDGGVAVSPVLPGDGGLGEGNFQEGLQSGINNDVLAMDAIIAKMHELGFSSEGTDGVYGRSNGGEGVGLLLNARPKMFGAAVTESGVHSIIDSPTINPDTGAYWKDEFGDPRNPAQFKVMKAQDVINNLSKNTQYPPTMGILGTIDGVVNPGNTITYATIRQGMGNGEMVLYSRFGEGHDPTSLAIQTAFLKDKLSVAKPAGS